MLYRLSYQSDADTRDRTRDLQIFSLTLSQLSYSGKWGHGGIEPPTSPTLKENHTTRPMPHGCDVLVASDHAPCSCGHRHQNKKFKGRSRDRTGDLGICNPTLYR